MPKNILVPELSPMKKYGRAYIAQGISILPIIPGRKCPGVWSSAKGWRPMDEWDRYQSRYATDLELEIWETWPDCGIGAVMGEISNRIALDFDYDFFGLHKQIEEKAGESLVKKVGRKGFTAFYRYSPKHHKSHAWEIGGMEVVSLLSTGRQTVLPDTLHSVDEEGKEIRYGWFDDNYTLLTYKPEELEELLDVII